MIRVSKNPEKSETRPDPNFSGFLRYDLRNLKFYEVKPRPNWTRIFGLGFFLGFLGFRDVAHPTNSQKGVKIFLNSRRASPNVEKNPTLTNVHTQKWL